MGRAELTTARLRRRHAWLACVATLAFSAPAWAEDRAHALELFERSERSYSDGRFDEAIALLKEAYREQPEPVLLYNLGRAYEALGDRKHAADAYEAYMAQDPNVPDRGATEGRVATLRRQLAADEAARAAPQGPQPGAAPHASPSLLPWVLGGVGIVGLGLGTMFGVLATSRHDLAARTSAQRDANARQLDAQQLATIANVAFAAGGLLTVIGITWGVVSLRVAASPRGAAVAGTW